MDPTLDGPEGGDTVGILATKKVTVSTSKKGVKITPKSGKKTKKK